MNEKCFRQICNSCRDNENYINEKGKAIVLSTDHDGSKAAGECRIFQQFVTMIKMIQDAHVKLNPGLPWQEWHSKT